MDTNLCKIKNCNEQAIQNGFCELHYREIYNRLPKQIKPELCSVENCSRPNYQKGYCLTHYTRQLRYGDVNTNLRPELSMTIEERLLKKIQIDEKDCWIWTGKTNWGGYAMFACHIDGQRIGYAMRASYLVFKGPIPKGKHLDHLCRNRACINPDHLEIVTPRENILRGEGLAAKEAKQTHCKRGHEFTEANTRHYRGRRYCRACEKARYVPGVGRVRHISTGSG